LLTRSGLTYLEVSSKVCHDSLCQLRNSISLPWVIYYESFYLHVISSFSCIPVNCPKLVLFLNPLQFAYLFCNLSECILMFISYISSQPLLALLRVNSPENPNGSLYLYTGLFISPSRISELDCATTKTDTAERSISIGRESLQDFLY